MPKARKPIGGHGKNHKKPVGAPSKRAYRTISRRKKLLTISDLPTINALLNTLSGILLTIGYVLIRQRKIEAHKTACSPPSAVSALFLVCYLVYHYHAGSKAFPGQGWIRPLYFTILISHIILAFFIVPLALRTLYPRVEETFFRAPPHRENHLPYLDVCLRNRSPHLFDALSTPLVLQTAP